MKTHQHNKTPPPWIFLCCGCVAVDGAIPGRLFVLKATLFRAFTIQQPCLDTQTTLELAIFDHCLDHCLDTMPSPIKTALNSPKRCVCIRNVAKINNLENIVAVRFAVCRNIANSQAAKHLKQ